MVRETEDPAEAAETLRAGGLAVVPTETVYGLAADATNAEAIARIYAVKGRPSFNPLICHVPDVSMADRLGELADRAHELAARFWPGPLTIVVPLRRDAGVAPAVVAGLETIALRHPVGPLSDMARALGRPIAAPSANISGGVSSTGPSHLAPLLDRLDPERDILVRGRGGDVGIESTIVSVASDPPRLLRAGGVARRVIEAALGAPLAEPGDAIQAPGMLASHYAPDGTVRLNARDVENDEFLIGFGPERVPGRPMGTFVLSQRGDLDEAARRLFDALHAANAASAKAIAVEPIPNTGIGEAINDRLRRAAAPR